MPDDHAPPRSFAIVKQLTPVRLVMVDGTALEGSLFISAQERVQDLLNDPKPFMPFRTGDGTVLIVNKASISVCQPFK